MPREKLIRYRLTDQDHNTRGARTYRDALELQKEMYRNGAERVEIAREVS